MSSILQPSRRPIAPIDQSQIPADVRKAGPKAEQLY